MFLENFLLGEPDEEERYREAPEPDDSTEFISSYNMDDDTVFTSSEDNSDDEYEDEDEDDIRCRFDDECEDNDDEPINSGWVPDSDYEDYMSYNFRFDYDDDD